VDTNASEVENVIPTEPGIYPNISGAVYASIDAINQTPLKIVGERSPAHYRANVDQPKEPSLAMEFGSAWHAAVLEPERFDAEYAGMDTKIDRRFKAGKIAWAEFEAENEGKTILQPGDMPRILAMREVLWDRADCRKMLRGNGRPLHECAVVWNDRETGVLCKGRVDSITPEGFKTWTCVVDLKTCKDASFAGFRRTIASYGYDYQMAYYLDGLDAIAPAGRLPIIIAQETEYPYAVAIHELVENDLDFGRARYRSDLEQVAACLKSGTWPGYPQGPKLCPIPPWRQQERELQETIHAR